MKIGHIEIYGITLTDLEHLTVRKKPYTLSKKHQKPNFGLLRSTTRRFRDTMLLKIGKIAIAPNDLAPVPQ